MRLIALEKTGELSKQPSRTGTHYTAFDKEEPLYAFTAYNKIMGTNRNLLSMTFNINALQGQRRKVRTHLTSLFSLLFYSSATCPDYLVEF